MEQRPELGAVTAAGSWESALAPRPDLKFDNRPYLVAAYAGWVEARNQRITAVAVEEQIVPDAYASGYRTPMA